MSESTEVKTEFTFAELSEAAQQAVRERQAEHVDYDWWDFEFEDFETILGLMDMELEVTSNQRQRRDGTPYVTKEYGIGFTGFYSQGDGASWEGIVRFGKPEQCLPKIMEHAPNDEELHALATRLDTVRAEFTMRFGGFMETCTSHMRIKRDASRYSHSNTMQIDNENMASDIESVLNSEEADEDAEPAVDVGRFYSLSEEVLQICKDLADWLYANLATQYEWLISDECIIEEGALYNEEGDLA